MKLLIYITSSSELACYEAMALALTMATFDHMVEICLNIECLSVLSQNNSRLTGMIKSLPLYDIPPVWISQAMQDLCADWLDKDIIEQIRVISDTALSNAMDKFDKVLVL